MKTRNSCYTRFKIIGSFDPDRISDLLGLSPERIRRIGDLRRNGTPYELATWEIGKCDEYDVKVENQMRKTIAVLQDKIPILNQIRQSYNASFFLEIVPSIYVNDVTPCLAPSMDVIDFCHATRTGIDIDLYVYNSKED